MSNKFIVYLGDINNPVKYNHLYPLDWSYIPDMYLDRISKYLVNISAVTSEGELVEKTVLYIEQVDDFGDEYSETVNIIFPDSSDNIILGLV